MSENLPKPRFTGIFIPVEILSMKDISPTEILLLSWIDALFDEKFGGCWASNEYLADKLQVKPNTIAKSLTKFRSLKLIEDISFDGRIRVIKSTLHISSKIKSNSDLDDPSNAALEKNPTPIGKKSNPPVKDIHISDSKAYIKEDIPPSSLALGLSSFLSEKIKKNNPKAKSPNLDSWAKVFDLMMKHDDFSEPEIRELIEFSQSDTFWHANILSPMKLRKHASTLVLQMKKSALKPSNDVLERSSENKTWATEKSKEVIRGSLFGKVRIWDARAEVYIPHSEEWISLDYRELAFREQFISLLRKGGYL